MKLLSVYRHKDSVGILYEFLKQRMEEPKSNISHTKLPSLDSHTNFFYHGTDGKGPPYQAWYFILDEHEIIVGSVYLSKHREIGVYISPEFRSKGYGKQAIMLLMEKWPGRFLANINPENEKSRKLFQDIGFDLLQVTYAKQ